MTTDPGMDDSLTPQDKQRLEALVRAVLQVLRTWEQPPAPSPGRFSRAFTWLTAHWSPLQFFLAVGGFILACLIYQVSPFLPLKEIRYKQDISRQQAAQRAHTRTLVDGYLQLGKTFLDIGQYTGAELMYNDVLKLQPTNPAARFGLEKARMYTMLVNQQFDPEVIEKRLHFLKDQDPKDPHPFVFLGDLFARLDPTTAASHYQHALKLDREVATAYFGLGLIYHNQGQTAQALGMFQEAVKRSPWNQAYLNNVAALYYESKHYAQAVEHYERALRLDADFLIAYHEMALAYRLQGHLDDARFYQKELVRLLQDPKVTALKKNTGVWYFKSTDDRIDLYELPEKRAYAYYSLSLTLFLLGQQADAATYVKQAQNLGAPIEQRLRPLIVYDLQRLATEQRQFAGLIAQYQESLLTPPPTDGEATSVTQRR